jgi:hypothetical protein
VVLVSTTLAVALLAYVAVFGSNIPIGDDWELVPFLTGPEPFRWAWLWAQHNEHRIPLPKLAYLALWQLSGGDFRGGMFFNAACLVLLTGLLLGAGRAAFGRLSWLDLFFPLALLHWGQFQNLLWHFQVQFLLSTLLAGLILAVLVQVQGLPTRGQGLAVGVALCTLPFTGANGLALVPALALWLLLVGLAHGRAGGRQVGALLILLAGAALVMIPISFLNYEAAHTPPVRSLVRALQTAAQFWGMAAGPLGERGWPLVSLALVALALGAVAVAVRAARSRPEERFRALGLVLYLGAFASLALGIGWGRSHLSAAGFANRYSTLAAPALCAVYFTWRLYGDRRLSAVLALLVVLLFPYNLSQGLAKGRQRQWLTAELMADIRADLPSAELGKKYGPGLYMPGQEDLVARRFEMLQQARQGPYREISRP